MIIAFIFPLIAGRNMQDWNEGEQTNPAS